MTGLDTPATGSRNSLGVFPSPAAVTSVRACRRHIAQSVAKSASRRARGPKWMVIRSDHRAPQGDPDRAQTGHRK